MKQEKELLKKGVIGKRKKLIALLSAVAVLAAGAIGTGVAFAAMAAVKKSATSSQSLASSLSSPSLQSKDKGSRSAVSRESFLSRAHKRTVAGSLYASPINCSENSTACIDPFLSSSPYVPSYLTLTSPQVYPGQSFSLNFSQPSKGLDFYPFDIVGNTSYPQNINPLQIKEQIANGMWLSTISLYGTNNGYHSGSVILFGGEEIKDGEWVANKNVNDYEAETGLSNVPAKATSPSLAAVFLNDCQTNAEIGPENMKQLLGASSSSSLTPAFCSSAFEDNFQDLLSFGGQSYQLTNPSQFEQMLSTLDYQTIPDWVRGSISPAFYMGPKIEGSFTLKVNLSAVAVKFMYDVLNIESQSWQITALYLEHNTQSQQNSVYSSSGANITAKAVASAVSYSRQTSISANAQLFGSSPDNFYDSSLSSSPSPASPAGPIGLWFKAVNQNGSLPQKVKIAVEQDSYYDTDYFDYSYLWPAYFDPTDPLNSASNSLYNGPDSLGTPVPQKYKYVGWNSPNNWSGKFATFTLPCVPGHPGLFTLSGLPAGEYTIVVDEEGSDYTPPSFNLTLSSYSSPETFSSSNDPNGFVDASNNTVVINAENPSTQVLDSQGKTLEESDPDEVQGSSHTFAYQLSSYLPFSSPFSINLDSGTGYGINLSEGKVAGIPISTLEEHGASLSGNDLILNSSAITYIYQNGFTPVTASSPVGTVKLSTSSGTQRIFSMEFPAYLTSSFKASSAISYSLLYSNTSHFLDPQSSIVSSSFAPGQTLKGSFETIKEVSASPAGGSSTPESGAWFRAISEDGKPLTQITIQYTELLSNYNSGATGTLTLTSPSSSPGLFTLPSSLDSYMQDGNSLQIGVEERDYYFDSSPSGSSFVNLFDFSSLSGGNAQFSLTALLNFSGAYGNTNTTSYDGLINLSTRTVIVNASNPSSQVLSPDGKVDTSSNPTYTVGSSNLFTYQLQTLLAFPYENVPEVIQILNGTGEKVAQDPSDIEVAGIPLSTLEKEGAALYDSLPYIPYSGNGAGGNSTAALTLVLPPKALSYIEQNGYLPATSSSSAGSSPLNESRQLSISLKAYLCPTQGKMQSLYYTIGMYTIQPNGTGTAWAWYKVAAYASRKSPTSNLSSSSAILGGGTSMPFAPVYTNGPSDNSTPSSLAKATSVSYLPLSSPSSSTGLWFINGLEDACGADATQFTVQNSSGQYLSPVEDGGTFEGWKFSSSPYDFKGSDFNKYPYYYLFTFGGLQDGTYTVRSVEHPDISFTSSLSYSSPQVLSGSGSFSFVESNPGAGYQGPISWKMEYAVKDGVLEMTNSSGAPVSQSNPADAYALISTECAVGVPTPPAPVPTPPSPSHLPFTGGKGILGLSLASSFLFLLGAGVWWGLKKKRGSHASLDDSPKKHGF